MDPQRVPPPARNTLKCCDTSINQDRRRTNGYSTSSNVERMFADMGVEAMHLRGARLSASSVVVVASSIWFFCLFYCVELTPNAFVFGDEAGYFLPLIFGASATNYQRGGS